MPKYDLEAACDSLVWSYLKRLPTNMQFASIYEGGLFNDINTGAELNVAGMNRDVKYGCGGRSLYATRDIPAGEELRLD